MKHGLIAVTLTFCTLFCKAQNPAFPQSFVGSWKGSLQWISPGRPAKKFAMQLHIKKADSANHFTWTIIYGDSGKDVRNYILKPVDGAKGHWVVDERDGILLDSYVLGNCLQGAFTVSGTTIVDNYCVTKNKMTVQFFTLNLDEKKQSGLGTQEVPFVDSYRVRGYQWGELVKIK